MDWFTLEGIPWLGFALAFVASVVFGSVWYSPPVLFKPWQRANGFTDEDMKSASMGVSYGTMIAGSLMGLLVLAVLLVALGVDSWWACALTGAIIGFAMRGGAHLLHDGFALRSQLGSWIDIAHDTLALALGGLIMGLFL